MKLNKIPNFGFNKIVFRKNFQIDKYEWITIV